MRLVYWTLAWIIGLVIVQFVGWMTPHNWAWATLVALVALFVCLWRNLPITPIMIGVMLFAGAWRMSWYAPNLDLTPYNGLGGLTLSGIVLEEPSQHDDGQRFILAVEQLDKGQGWVDAIGRAFIQTSTPLAVQYGDRVMTTGLLTTPTRGDTFDLSTYLARQDTYSVMDNAIVTIESSGHGNRFRHWLIQTRQHALQKLQTLLPDPQASLLAGIVLGYDDGIAPAIEDLFQTSGTAHLIAISGFNMALLAELLRVVLQRLRLGRGWVAILTIGMLAVYGAWVGASASVLRAVAMSSVLLVGRSLRRRTFAPASLGLAIIVLTAISPRLIFDVGFQLSVAGTLGLAFFAVPLTHHLANLFALSDDTAHPILEAFAVTLAATLTTLPLMILYFRQVSLIQLPVNLLVMIFQPPILILGLGAVMSMFLMPMLAQLMAWMAMVLLSVTLAIMTAFSQLPFAEITFYLHERWVIWGYVVVMGGVILQLTKPSWLVQLGERLASQLVTTTTLIVSVLLACLLGLLYSQRSDGLLHIYLLDIGHSNGILIESPNGAHMLIDGGRFPTRLITQVGEILPFVDREIELVFVTQPDVFQTRALPDLLERYRVGVVLTNGHQLLGEDYQTLETALESFTMRTVLSGDRIQLSDGLTVEVLNPPNIPYLADGLDDNALVLKAHYGELSFLFTSDLSVMAQTTLLDSDFDLTSAVLQLPQQATRNSLSQAFLEAVQPQVLLLQSERGNPRGDPDGDILHMVENIPHLLRTDEGGQVHLVSDGHRLWVYR